MPLSNMTALCTVALSRALLEKETIMRENEEILVGNYAKIVMTTSSNEYWQHGRWLRTRLQHARWSRDPGA
jgi:hypothetical protein